MKPSRMIELAISRQFYGPADVRYMCIAIEGVSWNYRSVERTQRLIRKAIAPYGTLSGYLKEQQGEWPTWEQRLEFWEKFQETLKKQNL